MNKSKSICLLLGTFLTNIIFFSLVITTSLFFVNITVTQINLILAVVFSIVICYFISNKNLKQTLWIFILSILIIIGTIMICGHSFDPSYDGNTYHKAMTGFMKNGWNPLRKTFYDFADSDFPSCSILSQTWLDAYPKGAEIFAACIYAVTGNIESGKCFNLLSCIAIGLISYGFLCETVPLKKWQSVICSIFLCLNPVAFSQFFTYYIDGFLWQFFLLCMFCLAYLTLYREQNLTCYCCYMLFVSIVVGLNLKFSSLIYFGLPCMVFFLFWCFKIKNRNQLLKRFILLASGALMGICYAGSTSYIINIIRHNNPVYTMIGEGSTDLVTVQLPKVYQSMNNSARFIGSLFSKTSNSKAIEQIEWKLPFSCHPNEFAAAQGCDVRTAGWGILFSGILLISIAIVIVALVRYRKTNICHVIYLLFGIMLFSIIFVPGLSWARYFGALFYIPVMAMVYLFIRFNKSNSGVNIILAFALSLLLFINMIPNIVFSRKIVINEYKAIVQELENFRNITKENTVVVSYGNKGRFPGRIFTLMDMDIVDYSFEEVMEAESSDTLFPYCGLQYKIIK
ncbi:MAG: hypothetical protein Q4F83_00015 [Eubacteriales bacterium]|nr:hypothetical protein [Eubacteriales bacterium]